MATELTEYERRRLENIKRNGELMASLNIQSRLAELSSTKPKSLYLLCREIAVRAYKIRSVTKEDLIFVRRKSMRKRGMTPDSKGLGNDFLEPKMTRPVSTPSSPPRVLGPLAFRDYCSNDSKSDVEAFARSILSISNFSSIKEESEVGSSMKEEIRAGIRYRKSSRKRKSESHGCKEEIGAGIQYKELSRKMKSESNDCKFELESLSLNPENIASVVPGRVYSVTFFPTHDMEMLAVGDKYGNVGFWNMKPEDKDNSIHQFRLHTDPISGILIHPFSLSKVYTSCYDGMVRVMNIEKQVFDLVYSVDYSIYSLAQKPDDVNSIYMGEYRVVNLWDERMGKIASSWDLHRYPVSSIDFNSSNTMIMATSSTEGTACIWDLRKMSAEKSVFLRKIEHQRAVHSAYFSPSGIHLATTSIDNTIGVTSGRNFEDVSMIHHDNKTSRWLSQLKAIWGWDDEHLYVGNLKGGIDIVSVSNKKIVDVKRSEFMTTIPCRFDAHPCKAGALAGAAAGGQVYVWTPPS